MQPRKTPKRRLKGMVKPTRPFPEEHAAAIASRRWGGNLRIVTHPSRGRGLGRSSGRWLCWSKRSSLLEKFRTIFVPVGADIVRVGGRHLGGAGIVMTAPHTATTTLSAPAARRTSRTVPLCPLGVPLGRGWSRSDCYCVLGRLPDRHLAESPSLRNWPNESAETEKQVPAARSPAGRRRRDTSRENLASENGKLEKRAADGEFEPSISSE